MDLRFIRVPINDVVVLFYNIINVLTVFVALLTN